MFTEKIGKRNKIHLHHLIIFKLPRQIPLHPFLPSLLNPRISTGSANGEFATQGIPQGMRRIRWDDQNLFERQGWMYTRMSHLDGEDKNAENFRGRISWRGKNIRERLNIYRDCISLLPQNPRSANAILGCSTIGIAYEDESSYYGNPIPSIWPPPKNIHLFSQTQQVSTNILEAGFFFINPSVPEARPCNLLDLSVLKK